VLIEALGVIRAQAIAIARNAIDLVNAFAELVTAAGKAGVSRRAASQPVAVAPVVPEPDPRSTPAAAVASEPDGGRGATIAATSTRGDGDDYAAAMRAAELGPQHRGEDHDVGELAGDRPEQGARAAASVRTCRRAARGCTWTKR